MANSSSFDIICPCCGALMVVDPETRVILRHEEAKKPLADFEQMLKGVGKEKAQRESKLARAMDEQKNREEILEKKFREAVKKAESTPEEKPVRPFDLD